MQESVKSIKNQTFKDFEVWIIDGGSSLKTQNYLNLLEKPFFYQSRLDKGVYDAMNKGIELAKGEWLYFLGSGDVLHNKNILSEVFFRLSYENIGLIAGKIVYNGFRKPFVYSKNKKVKNINWSKRMWLLNGLHHQGTFYKKELFNDRNYTLKYKTLSDYHLNLQLLKADVKCVILDLVIANCNSDGISKTGNWKIYKEEINLKTDLSSILFRPFFFSIAFTKFLSRKIVND